MFSRDTWKEIFDTIGKNKLRTFLSGFTVALGILIFVTLFGLGNGLINSFKTFFEDDAENVMFLFPGRTSEPYKGFKANRSIEFDNSDLDDIANNFSMFLEYQTPRTGRNYTVSYRANSNNYTTFGVGPAYRMAEKTILMRGRYLNQEDIRNRTKIAVIGRLVEKDLFGEKTAIGKYVNMGGIMFKVVGVFQDEGGDNLERQIHIPYTTLQRLEKNTDEIGQIIVAFKPELGLSGAMAFERSLMTFLKSKKNISPTDPNGIFIRNIADALNQTQQFAGVLQMIVAIVAIGTIIAGIIGISNIMVFVVKERTKEIGIRKALGATPSNVISTILLESVFITTFSGFSGMLIGVFILNSIGDDLEDYFILDPYIGTNTALAATVVLIIFGAIAGYIPASRAARIKPIVALRDE